MCALLLTQSTPPSESIDPYETAECWTETPVGEAPRNVELQLKLDPALASPQGVVLPPSTARYVLWKLQCLKHWPAAAQAKLEEQAQVDAFLLAREKQLNDIVVKEVEPAPQGIAWSWFFAGVGGALVTGLVVGYVVGR